MFLCSLTLLEMTLHVNLPVITGNDIRNVISVSIPFVLHCFGGGGGAFVCVKAVCVAKRNSSRYPWISLRAVDPGKCSDCHLLDKQC